MPGTDLGSGDTGVLNGIYLMKQLQAAFYAEVINKPYVGLSTSPLELAYYTDIRDHEITQREFIKNVLGGGAIPTMTVNFTSIDFQKRTSVLDTAIFFEDLGVATINGAVQLMTNPVFMLDMAKIASVEARHAATVRDFKASGTFADATVISGAGLDTVITLSDAVQAVSPYVIEKLNTGNLPKS